MKFKWPWSPKSDQVKINFPPYDPDQLSQTIFGPKGTLPQFKEPQFTKTAGGAATLPESQDVSQTPPVNPWPPTEEVANPKTPFQ